MPPIVREIAIEDKALVTSDVSSLIRLFFERMTVANAKTLAGTVVLVFPKYDTDNRPSCIIPEIRAYIQKLQAEDSRFPYYYLDEGAIGAHLVHLACLSPVNNIVSAEGNSTFRLKMDGPDLVYHYLEGIAVFMQQLGYREPEIADRIQSVQRGLGLG